MIILGIDPGTATTGYGLIEADRQHCRLVGYGTVKTTPDRTRAERLRAIYEGLDGLLTLHQPHVVAVEQLFFTRNVSTAMAVGEARGVALLVAARHNRPVFEYTPTAVKNSLSGFGKAGKNDIKLMVTWALELDKPPRPDDAADALAIALCHLYALRNDGGWPDVDSERMVG